MDTKHDGASCPACQAITASTANSGSVCSQARIASASPCDIMNCAASAPHATRKALSSMLGKVQSAVIAEAAALDAAALASLILRRSPGNSFRLAVERSERPRKVARRPI